MKYLVSTLRVHALPVLLAACLAIVVSYLIVYAPHH